MPPRCPCAHDAQVPSLRECTAHCLRFRCRGWRGSVPTTVGLHPRLPFSDTVLGSLCSGSISPLFSFTVSFSADLCHFDTQASLRNVQGHFPCQLHLQPAGFTTLPTHPGWNSCLSAAQWSSLNVAAHGMGKTPLGGLGTAAP